ncbi:hypothetical protein ACFT9I_02420 [Streptomyces sp. NPDC057137]|uniref:hypothetical protein n=1 Tax=Streptomyces sp. NPDC057137 TaxID=3346030 RepID=UPI00364437BB
MQNLPHYWKSLPSDSPLKKSYAQPDAVDAKVAGAAALGVVGLVVVGSGAMFGLLLLLGAGLWGVAGHRLAEDAEAAREVWAGSLICLVCTDLFRA